MGADSASITAELYKAIVAIVDDHVKEIRVTREDFSELRSAVNELAEAQTKTEEAVERLVKGQRELSVEVGKLSAVIGFGIEDIGKVVLPGYLEHHFGIEVEELERKFFLVDGEEIEIDLYGEGVKKGKGIVILGETKSRIYRREVDDFILDVSKLTFREEVFKVLFGFFIHPSATELAEREGIVLVASYQR